MPDGVFASGHFDSSEGAQITFGDLAKANGSSPTYDYTKAACSNTYCHQSIVPTNNPNWQAPRDSTAACGSCHGLPPALPHPQNSNCSQCHAAVIDANRNFVNKSLHLDGTIEFGNKCNSCHGTDPNTGGPPPDLEGNSDPQYPGVGAHTNHLQASATHGPVACSECHVVPSVVPTADNLGHAAGTPPANVTFGTLAISGNNSPVFDATTQSCSGTYCHQAYNPANNPNWTAPLDSTKACGTCHALPPPLPHPQITDCSQCHAQVIDADRNFANPALHVDGIIEANPPCYGCHGDAQRPGNSVNPQNVDQAGPPVDLGGNSDVTLPGVGAHQRHLQAANTHGPVACDQCHVVPTAWNSPGHDVTSAPPAAITFGSFEQNNNLTAIYSSTDHTCSNTYCHASYVPNWIAQKDSTQTCGTCHALPPPFSAQNHPQINDCSRCHGAVIDSSGNFVAPSLHVDGQVEVVSPLVCSSCHGDSSRSSDDVTNAAPPTDLSGNTDVASLGVGAHQAHLTGISTSFPTASFRPVPCLDCHTVPQSGSNHPDTWTAAVLTFSEAAIAGGQSPVWNSQTATCTGSWCHGPGALANVSPVWNDPSVSLSCTSCHGFPPAAPHPQLGQCYLCHTNVSTNLTIIDPTLHVNGTVDF